jgi:hypothetical protein
MAGKDRGVFHVIYPGILEVMGPLNDERQVDAGIGILKYIRDVLDEQKNEIPPPVRDIQESDLLSLDDLRWGGA